MQYISTSPQAQTGVLCLWQFPTWSSILQDMAMDFWRQTLKIIYSLPPPPTHRSHIMMWQWWELGSINIECVRVFTKCNVNRRQTLPGIRIAHSSKFDCCYWRAIVVMTVRIDGSTPLKWKQIKFNNSLALYLVPRAWCIEHKHVRRDMLNR